MKRFRKILCIVQDDADSRAALARALALADSNQAELTVATVIESVPVVLDTVDAPDTTYLSAALEADARERIDELIRIAAPDRPVATMVLQGTPFLQVIRVVLRNGFDLVIKTPGAPGWLDRMLAADDMHLLRKCPCPVWMVKAGAAGTYRRVVAAVDVDDALPVAERETRRALNLEVVELAAALAIADSAELHLVHAWGTLVESALRRGFLREPEAVIERYLESERQYRRTLLEQLIEQATARIGVDAMHYLQPQVHLVKGPARREIPAFAMQLEADCLVMGTVARTGVSGLIIGNTAESILAQIGCSVLAIKPPGFATPVDVGG